MEELQNWVNCILITVTIIGIVEFLLPEGDTKKFCVVLLGIITSLMIATPVIACFSGDFNLEKVLDLSSIQENTFYLETLKNTANSQVRMVEEIYSQKTVDTFNRTYSDMRIDGCVTKFQKDENFKIIGIDEVVITITQKVGDLYELKSRIALICDVDIKKVRVNIE